MDDDVALGEQAWEKVVSVLGKPGHCKYVDKATQAVVKSALRSQNITAPPQLRNYLGQQTRQLCTTKLTPEGRTLIILAAGAAATVYTVMNYDEVEDAILAAARKAKIPLKIPIPSQYGKLTAKIGFDSARANWELRNPNGLRLNAFFEQPYSSHEQATYGLGASRQFTNGNMNFSAGVNAEGAASVMFKLEFKF